MQALAESPRFDDLIETLASQHEKLLKQQQQPVIQLPQQPITNEVSKPEDTQGETGDDDGDYEWIEVDAD